MNQDACFPSLTLSTVVLATPATSPPHQTFGSDVAMVSGSTTGNPHLLNFSGVIAFMTGEGGGEGREGVELDKGKEKIYCSDPEAENQMQR